jgi:hypothetical protein
MLPVRRTVSKAVGLIANAPLIVRHSLYAAFDVWPHAGRVSEAWRDVPVYCLSVKSEERRRAIVSRQLESTGFRSFEYVYAPDLSGSSLEELERQGLYDDAQARLYHGKSLRLPQISCSLGHGLACERIVADGHPIALIIEDDALFMSRRFARIGPDDFPSDFDVVALHSFRTTERPDDHKFGCLFGANAYRGSTCAYVVSARGSAKMAAAYKPVFHAADGFLGRCLEWPDDLDHPFKRKGARTTLRAYLTIPDLVLNGSDCYYYKSFIRAPKQPNLSGAS